MAQWTAFPTASKYSFGSTTLKKHWSALHAGDAEPLPKNPDVLHAWSLLHKGEFAAAVQAAVAAGNAGTTAANKATCIYANYLEKREKTRLDLFLQAAERAEAQQKLEPENANAFYWHAYALGRYSQGISVAKALAQGLGGKVKAALEKAIALEPKHADAHIALAAFHAEVIDKVGALIGGMTYGVKKSSALQLYAQGLKLHPSSASGLTEYANGLSMLEGEAQAQETERLYQMAVAIKPLDAVQWLEVEAARAELAVG